MFATSQICSLSSAVLVALVVQNTSLVFAMKYAYRKSAPPFHASVVVAASEALKLCMSMVVVVVERQKRSALGRSASWPIFDLQLAVPSLLYIIQNNLLFFAVSRLSPTVYLACTQSKIITTALFSKFLLGTSLRWVQVISLALMTAGMILVQLPEGRSRFSEGESHFAGLIAVSGASMTSGFAGVYLERLFKTCDRDVGIFGRNVQLAVFSLPIAIFWSLSDNFQGTWGTDLLQGFDGIIILIIFLQAVGGLIVGAVMKFASSVLKCFSIAASICLSVLISSHLGFHQMNTSLMMGTLLVITSIFMYSRRI